MTTSKPKHSRNTFKSNNPDLRIPIIEHIRTHKPGYYTHEGIAEMSIWARYAWMGIWNHSDKFGRFPWRSKLLKSKIYPYDDVDFEAILQELVNHGFIRKYTVDGQDYGLSLSWKRHQGLGTREKASEACYPAPPLESPEPEESLHSASTVPAQSTDSAMSEGVGKGVGVSHSHSHSLGGR